ncbi:MAG: hypothetical protein QXT10_04000 [Candidatus Bathyarchaeia archaeon]
MPKIKRGQLPERVAEETDYSILKSLRKALAGYRFSELLKVVKPRIVRDTLARHLKTLYAKKLVGYDKLDKRYYITDKGVEWLKRFEIESLLRSRKWVIKGVASPVEVAEKLVNFLAISQIKALTESLQKAEAVKESFVKAFSWDVYSDLPIELDEEFRKSFGFDAGKLVLGLVSRVREEAKARLDRMERAKLLVVLEFDFKRYAEAQLEWLKARGVGGSG